MGHSLPQVLQRGSQETRRLENGLKSLERNRCELANRWCGTLILSHHPLERPMMFVKRLPAIGDQNLSRMKCRIDLAHSHHRRMAIGASRYNVISECLASEIVSPRCAHFCSSVGNSHARVGFIHVGVRIVNRDGEMRQPFQVADRPMYGVATPRPDRQLGPLIADVAGADGGPVRRTATIMQWMRKTEASLLAGIREGSPGTDRMSAVPGHDLSR